MTFYRKMPTRWTGDTGRALRGDLVSGMVAEYLTCPVVGTPYGVYPVEPDDIARYVGMTVADVNVGLLTLERLRFIDYHRGSTYIWVREMAAHQFDLPLRPGDYAAKGAKRWYLRESRHDPFLGPWFDRYADDFAFRQDEIIERREGEAIGAPPVALVPARRRAREAPMTGALFEETMPAKRAPDALGKPHPIRDLLVYYDEQFTAKMGARPHIDGGKDAKAVEALLKNHGEPEVRAAIDRMFRTTDPFITNSGYTVGVLRSCFNKLLVECVRPIQATAKTSKTAGAIQRFAERGE